MNLSILTKNKHELFRIIKEISSISSYTPNKVSQILNSAQFIGFGPASKSKIKEAYLQLRSSNRLVLSKKKHINFLNNIKLKNIRTLSGVTPVTVMTKPYPCPGKCIYCPNEKGVPKSYIANEPGAQRAILNNFDPYLQTYNRLVAYKNNGHPTDKVELIIIGGTWSYYPRKYQTGFVRGCIEAMNDFNKNSVLQKNIKNNNKITSLHNLYNFLKKNETSKTRCVGMSIETRPDYITTKELIFLRKLGITKVQLGVQSLNDQILKKVRRGHSVQKTAEAIELLRQFGFKIQVHWMPNLLGATLKTDYEDYIKLCTHKNFIPDEIKIYPCSLIENTKLMSHYKDKSWVPYTYDELKKLIEKYLLVTPRYCRISRVIRDISSEDIFAGNRKSNLRQDVEKNITAKKLNIVEIRFREMKNEITEYKNLLYKETEYRTGVSKEVFMEMVDDKDRLAGFLRLSLPTCKEKIDELKGSAIIREIHVYGQSLPIGTILKGKAQHSGIGSFLINNAKKIYSTKGYKKLSVISSVGTKEYYRSLGFIDGMLYQHFY